MATDIKRFIQVYTGNGKGKTTAALGLSIRAAGHGLKTYMGQFMKGQHYGELTALRDNPFITIEQYGDVECIHRNQVTQKHKAQAEQGLIKSRDAMLSGQYDMVILDEINVTIWFGLLTVKQVLEFLDQRPQSVEVILTGRYAPQEFIEYADLVSEMKEVKHYYHDQGILARDGIER
ncbi:MAG: cob(I)yrinic acid a,c-diamide adenosyltransferase [Desulfobacterales bacterium]|jgi:cob(I)alamin adenosyltransferase